MQEPTARGRDALLQRRLPDGGFSGRAGGQYRPDATAWAALALADQGGVPELVSAARGRLLGDQLDDGRVPLQPEHPDVVWPTSAAMLAWRGSSVHREPLRRAADFLLDFSGLHWPPEPNPAYGHDPSLRGWPWVAGTHSWVEPTSLVILALEAAGLGAHERVGEAVRMLLDRQLPTGGWNYGNTTVFGSTLRPFPDSTGLALAALAGRVERRRVSRSLEGLVQDLRRVRTPLGLGWGLLGLRAWGERSPLAADWLRETWTRPEGLDSFDTAHLAVLMLASGSSSPLAASRFPGGVHAIRG
jgi:hypothetical protein